MSNPIRSRCDSVYLVFLELLNIVLVLLKSGFSVGSDGQHKYGLACLKNKQFDFAVDSWLSDYFKTLNFL